MSKLMDITQDFHFTKEQFFNERIKHLNNKGLSAKRIYRTEKSWSSLHKFSLEGWPEYFLLLGGFGWILIFEYLNFEAISIWIPVLMWITLIIKITIRRNKMWQKRYSYLKEIEIKRLEIEWQQYKNFGKNFSPNLVVPSERLIVFS
jgi:hypothetical protein